MIKKYAFCVPCLAGLAGLILLLAGCGPNTTKLNSGDMKAFDNAPADVKQIWDKALAAEEAKDYVTVQDSLDSLGKMALTDPQREAANTKLFAFQQKLWQAAEKGDPAAVKAVQEINKRNTRAR